MDATDRIHSGYKELFNGREDASDVGVEQSIPQFVSDDLFSLCHLVREKLRSSPMLMRVNGSFIVVGDIHGNFQDLIRIFRSFGMPPTTRYIFLGDYVDRGDYSVEVIVLLFVLYIKFPDDVILLRGNHEFSEICGAYGFKVSIEEQFGNVAMFHVFVDAFGYLPLAAILNKTVFLVHGGISQHLMHVEQIEAIEKPLNDDDDPMIKDLLWSDPSTTSAMFDESTRGELNTYGKTALKQFLERNKLKMMIRGHQFMENGAESLWSRTLCTVFSSSSYKYQDSNQAAVLKVSDKVFSCHRFPPIARLPRDQCSFFTMKLGLQRQDSVLCMTPAANNIRFANSRLAGSSLMLLSKQKSSNVFKLKQTGQRIIGNGFGRKKLLLNLTRDADAFKEEC